MPKPIRVFPYKNDTHNSGFGICIGTAKIQRKDVNVFRIHIDSKLAWKDHIKHIN